jgi:hypothetical protein
MVLNIGISRADIFEHIAKETKNRTAEHTVKKQRSDICDDT